MIHLTTGHPGAGMTVKLRQSGENACPLPAANIPGESLAALYRWLAGRAPIHTSGVRYFSLTPSVNGSALVAIASAGLSIRRWSRNAKEERRA